MNANGEQLHQLLAKLFNRVQNDSIDSLQSFDYLHNILQCLEQIKEPARLGSDSLLSETHSELNTELNTECLNVDLNSELINDSTNESDSGQQSSEEGSTINDLKVSTNQKCLFDLTLKLVSIILNHLVRQVNNKQDAELLINQWKNCSCFKQQKTNSDLNHKLNHNCSNNLNNNNQTTSLLNALQSSTIQSSGIQSDASCSPLSSLTTDCYANLSTNCSLSPSCCYLNANRNSTQNQKCSLSLNKTINCFNNCHNNDNSNHNCNRENSAEVPLNDNVIPINSTSNTTLNNNNNNNNSINDKSSIIPIPPPLPPPLPNQNGLDKSISNGSLNNQLLTNSFNSNLSNNLSPPQSINEVPVILLETPKPRSKMKTLNWNKISVHKVLTSHKPNIWSKLFSKKDDSKKSKQVKEEKNKKRKSKKNFSTDEETSDEEFKKSQRFSLMKRNKKADNNNNTTTGTSSSTILSNLTNRSQSLKSSNSSINSSTNNLSKTNSTSNNSIKTESSINSTTSSTSIRNKKQSEEDLMNIVKLDFDTLEGLFCQPNNQVNIGAGNVGNMIANFSTSNANNGEMISCPNSPASTRRMLQQQQSSNQSQQKLNSIYNQLNHSTQLNQQTNQLMNQANSNLQLNYSNLNLNQAYLNNYPLNSSQSNGQLNCKLNKLNNKLELNGRNSPNYFENSLDRKTLKQRCSGEFQPDFMMHNILDSKRSLNINIFLKQFRSVCSNDGEIEIMKLICKGDHAVFGAEKLVHLIKLLPDQAEIDLLKAHFDDMSRLPLAERFLIQLMGIPK